VDAEWSELLAQRQGHRLDRGLGGGVVAGALWADASTDGGEVDDRAGAPGPHRRQHRLDRAGSAEDVGVEQPPDCFVLAFLDGRAVAVAGVVDEDVDCAEAFLGCGDRRGDLLVAGDVERNRESLVRTGVGEALDLGDVAGGGDDVVPAVERGLGEGSAESGGAAGDEPRRHGGSPSRRQI
jgi:hypothetical protein